MSNGNCDNGGEGNGEGNNGNNGNKVFLVRQTMPEASGWTLVQAKSDAKAAEVYVSEHIEGSIESLAGVTVEVKKGPADTEIKTFLVTPTIEVKWTAAAADEEPEPEPEPEPTPEPAPAG